MYILFVFWHAHCQLISFISTAVPYLPAPLACCEYTWPVPGGNDYLHIQETGSQEPRHLSLWDQEMAFPELVVSQPHHLACKVLLPVLISPSLPYNAPLLAIIGVCMTNGGPLISYLLQPAENSLGDCAFLSHW